MTTARLHGYLIVLCSAVGCADSVPPEGGENDAGVLDADALDGGGDWDAEASQDASVDASYDIPVIRDLGTVADLGGAEDPLAADQLLYAMSVKYCREILTCTSTDDENLTRFIKVNEADDVVCVNGYVRLLASYSRLEENLRRVNEGRLVYDGLLARECVGTTTCERFDLDRIGSYGPCDTMFDGTVALGGVCEDSDDCQGIDAYCAIESGSCAGTCVATRAIGDACQEGRECMSTGATALVACDVRNASPTCKGFEYTTAPAVEGAACGTSSTESTVTRTNCPAGFFCDAPSWLESGVCRVQLAAGAACDRAQVCGEDLVCVRGETRTCGHEPPMAQFVGEACSDEFGPVCDSWRNLACVEGHCVALGDGSQGAACNYLSFCNAGLYCDATDHCAPQKEAGSVCHAPNECLSGSCDPETLVCGELSSC